MERPLMPMGAHRSGGLALIAVLWMVSLLTILATATLATWRSTSRIASRSAQLIAATATADSAIRLVLLHLYTPQSAQPPIGFSRQLQFKLFEQPVSLRVEREAGRVDLNATDASLLAAVFVVGGIDAAQAASFAARIIDWRDADDQASAGGAERADYALVKAGYEPRNGPFESVGELRQLLGLGDVSDTILDAFTVYSTRSPTIAREFAHPLVVAALALQGTTAEPAASLPPPSMTTTSHPLIGQAFRIHACAHQGVAVLCRAAIVRLMRNGAAGRPFLVHAWYTEH